LVPCSHITQWTFKCIQLERLKDSFLQIRPQMWSDQCIKTDRTVLWHILNVMPGHTSGEEWNICTSLQFQCIAIKLNFVVWQLLLFMSFPIGCMQISCFYQAIHSYIINYSSLKSTLFYNRLTARLKYIMLLNLPFILSSNSFLFYLFFSFLFLFYSHFILLYSHLFSTIKLLTIITTQYTLNYIVFID